MGLLRHMFQMAAWMPTSTPRDQWDLQKEDTIVQR